MDEMEPRHQDALTNFLEAVFFEGFASQPKWQVTGWYGQEKFTVNIRRDLRHRWKEMLKSLDGHQGSKLRLAEVDGKVIAMRNTDFYKDNE